MIIRNGLNFFLAALLVSASYLTGFAKTEDKSFDFRRGFAEVAAQALPAVVFIQVEKQVPVGRSPFSYNNPFDLFGEEFGQQYFFGQPFDRQHMPRRGRQPQQMFKQRGQGSGFLISKDGYILTNTHVVGDADKITVRLSNGHEYKATRVGADSKTEVALIKIEAKGETLPYLKAGDPNKLLTGEWVIAIGNPFGLKETLTVGVVSAKGRSNIGITDYEDFIQTDAAINPGNSGGPLLNIDGDVIGINTAIYSQSGGYMGIGFAVPIDMAMNIKNQLVTKGKVTRGYIGVMLNPGEVSEEMAQSFGRKEAGGVLIAEVTKDGPAEKAKIKSGDIIVEMNGKKVEDNKGFRNEVAQILPNTQVELGVYRDGKVIKVPVTVGAFPDEVGEGAEKAGVTDALQKIGFRIQELTKELAEQSGYETGRGVLITEVEPGSDAEEKGLRAGMLILEVNQTEVNNERQFENAVKKGKGGYLRLRVKSENNTFFLMLRMND